MTATSRPALGKRAAALLSLAIAVALAMVLGSGAMVARAAGVYPDGARGFDISWPQCGGVYPPPGQGVAVVGLNHGLFVENPCFDSEWAWASTSPNPPSVYVIDGFNPASTHLAGNTCNGNVDCLASTYGASAAAFDIQLMQRKQLHPAYVWLDTETTDPWVCQPSGSPCDTQRNAESVDAMVHAFRQAGYAVGIYSTPLQFHLLLGGYAPGIPTWYADYNPGGPALGCAPSHSTGGGDVFLVQSAPGQFDPDYSCPSNHGYYLVAGDGGIFPFGNAPGYGSTGNLRLNRPIVGMAAVPAGGGYWLVAGDGGIFPFGPKAPGYGSTGNLRLNRPIVGMAAAPDGLGYWLVASDGGIFPFGPSAPGYGSTGNLRLNQPIVGMAAAADGHGYWLVASDGGIFPFGPSARGYGSTGNLRLNRPIVGMAATQDGGGYWLVASDGGIFPFGDAPGYGSAAGMTRDSDVVGITRTSSGSGYWLLTAKGTVIPFGDAVGQVYGSWAPRGLAQPMLGIAAHP